ncbi:hypothetical protein EI94DRAFT_1741178 [Lactarius quietus]|nr:hypothetical protein EI94DRAFT_1741178 [Lactarius quietus]
MAGQPPHDDNDDLSSLFSRTSIQNSPDWPSVRLPSPGPSIRTLNQSDDGNYPDDLSSLANFSCEDLGSSDRGSVFSANISTSPSSSRPSTPSGSSHDQYQPLPSENSGAADKRSDQPGLPPLVLSSRKSTIGSTSEFQDDSSYHGVSLLIDNFGKDLPHRSVFTDIVPVPPRPKIPNGDAADRNTNSSEDRQTVRSNLILSLCSACGLPIRGAFVRALGTIFHLQCFKCIDCGDVVASKFFPIDDPNGKQQPLCEKDYFRRLNLVCAKCYQALRGSYVTACDKKYHVEHFTCTICPTLFGPQDSYYEHNNDVYCHYHYSTRFATKCTGCKTAILKQFVEINRNMRDECWHPECYMIHKFWNVYIVPRGPEVLTDPTEPPYLEEERQESRASLQEKQIKMEQQVFRIWTVLSAYEEASGGTVSNMLRHVSSASFLEAIRMAEGTVLHVEVLFATIDDLGWHFARLGVKGMSHVRESRMLCRKLVDLLTLLSRLNEVGPRRMGTTQELLALVTGLAHYLKILIRIALTGALRLEREHGSREALGSFLDKLHMLSVQNGSPSARRMTAGAKDVVPLSQRSASINTSTYGVLYGYRSLAPEIAGESPLLDDSQDFAISNVPVPSPPSDLCVACALTVEEDCVRLGTYQRWHSNCIRCKICGVDATPAAAANIEDKAIVKSAGEPKVGTVASVSTARRPPANVDLFVYSLDSVTNTRSSGEVPTAIYCTAHALLGCRGDFQAVSRLEQYAFLLNVALRRLHLLLKKRNMIPPTPSPTSTNTTSHSSGDTDSNPVLPDLMRSKSVLLDGTVSATAHISKRSTIVKSPVTEVAHSSDASVSKGNPPRGLPPEPTHTDIPRLGEEDNAVERRLAPPWRSIVAESPSGKVAQSRDASISKNNASKILLPEATPADLPQLVETEKKQRRPLPPVPTEKRLTLADIPQLFEAAQAMEQHRSTPPQNLPYVAELTPLELAIVRHAAVAVLCRSSLRDEMDLDQVLEMLEVKRQRFWERLFKPGSDRKKKGIFGVPLELLVERDGADSLLGASSRATLRVPCFLDDVISASRQMDTAVDFRKAGSIRRRRELITAIDRDPDSVDFTRERPEEIASVLKHFLCELPDPLMTFKLQGLFIAVTSLPNDEERKRLLHMLTLVLPKCHRDTLEILLVFLKRVSSFATVQDDIGTESYLSNLASVIGPSVLFSGNWVDMSRSTGGGVLMKYDAGTRAMTELLENQDQFFTVPEEFLPLLHDQDFFAGSMELSSKDFLKQCETYMRIKFGGPAAESVRIRGKTAERLRR